MIIMVYLRWDGDDFRNEQDSSGATADLVSHSGKLQQGYQHGSLTRGLVAYYPMEKGQGEVLHDGAMSNLGQINGAKWSTDSGFGSYSLKFDDSEDDYIVAENMEDWVNDGRGTIAYWVKISSLQKDGNSHPHVTYRASGGADRLQLENKNGKLRYWIRVDSNSQGYTTKGASTNTWYFIVGTVRKGTYKLYVDGSEQGNETTSDLSNHKNGILEIGGNSSQTRTSDSKISGVMVYDRALSKPEIQALYNLSQPSGTQITEKQVPSQNDGGKSRYKFNGTVNDSWGDNDGTDNTSNGYEEAVYAKGKSFDGDDDWVDLNETFLDGETHFTVSEWFKPESTSYTGIFGIWDNNTTSNRRVQIFWRGNDSSGGRIMQFLARDNSGNLQILDGNTSIEPDTGWHHIAITYDGNTQRLYINGKIDSQQEASFTVNTDTTYTDRISETPGNNNYRLDGAVDDLRIYKKALKPQQVEKLYHKGAYRIPRESTLQ